MRATPTPFAVLLIGCSHGGISTESVDDLDGIRSAVWFEWERNVDGTDEVWHEFVLSSHPGLCRDMQEWVPKMADAYADFAVASDNGDFCDALGDYYAEVSDITEPLYKRQVTTLSMTLRDPHDDVEDPPPEGPYDEGFDPDDPWFVGALQVWESNPFTELAASIGSCSNLGDSQRDALHDSLTEYPIDRGDVEAFERGDEAYRIRLDGDLEDDRGDDAGGIVARGTYQHCAISWDGWFEPFAWDL